MMTANEWDSLILVILNCQTLFGESIKLKKMSTRQQRSTFDHCPSVEHQIRLRLPRHSSNPFQKVVAVHHGRGVPAQPKIPYSIATIS